MYVIRLAKEPFKFSVSHFTIFAADRAERLHGHNYQIRVDVAIDEKEIDPKLGLAFDFNTVKPMIRELCDRLDERILIPAKSPYLKVEAAKDQIEVRFAKKFYSFPAEDALILPVVNITTEELARLVTEELAAKMKPLPGWTSLQVDIEETRGQSISYTAKR